VYDLMCPFCVRVPAERLARSDSRKLAFSRRITKARKSVPVPTQVLLNVVDDGEKARLRIVEHHVPVAGMGIDVVVVLEQLKPPTLVSQAITSMPLGWPGLEALTKTSGPVPVRLPSVTTKRRFPAAIWAWRLGRTCEPSWPSATTKERCSALGGRPGLDHRDRLLRGPGDPSLREQEGRDWIAQCPDLGAGHPTRRGVRSHDEPIERVRVEWARGVEGPAGRIGHNHFPPLSGATYRLA
jgi:hypothetical protein